jgi:hypothetical protein
MKREAWACVQGRGNGCTLAEVVSCVGGGGCVLGPKVMVSSWRASTFRMRRTIRIPPRQGSCRGRYTVGQLPFNYLWRASNAHMPGRVVAPFVGRRASGSYAEPRAWRSPRGVGTVYGARDQTRRRLVLLMAVEVDHRWRDDGCQVR